MRDRDLVRLYWPVELRPAFDALFGIDDAMAEVVIRSTEPALAAIKLAWWREALERLDNSPPPPEPRLQAVAAKLLPRGITGADVAAIEPGWATLLDDWPEIALINQRGALLFRLGGRLLGADDPRLEDAGGLFATIDLYRRGIEDSRSTTNEMDGYSFPRALRPLTALAALASRDLFKRSKEPEATPARAAALMWHRLTGRVA